MVALIAMMAAVRRGSWMDRPNLQAEADAAALAAAQELPDAPATAVAKAVEYAQERRHGRRQRPIQTTVLANDTVKATIQRTASSAGSRARLGHRPRDGEGTGGRPPRRATRRRSADIKHPLLQCRGPASTSRRRSTHKTGPGAFRCPTSTTRTAARAGDPGRLDPERLLATCPWITSDPGEFNSSQIRDAMTQRIGDEMLFPVYDITQKEGANLEYHDRWSASS
jgi:hypothetical protein